MGKVTQSIVTNKDVTEAIKAFKKQFEGKVYPEQVGPANELVIKPIDLTLGFLVPSVRMTMGFEKNGQGVLCSAGWAPQSILTVIALLIIYLVTFPASIILIIPVLLASSKMTKHLRQMLSDFKVQMESAGSSSDSDKYEQLEKLGALKEKGHISEEEFQREKEKLFNA
ncbi:MAG: hypothetical protein ACD_39C02121G0003 [uncultured bacterium]|nr:MAG: hypothetical protein ACD_39C02121G0003 [uncultured bacterium]